MAAWAAAARADETLRVATWHADLSRDGPGLLLRDLLADDDPALAAIVGALARVRPDAVLLTDIDYDRGGAALDALAKRIGTAGLDYSHHFQVRPNTGRDTGADVNRDGRLGTARDAQGWGRFAGEGGLALLSRWPVAADAAVDVSDMLWRDLPDTLIAANDPAHDVQRLSTSAHWAVPVEMRGRRVTLMAFHATPPVFDGPEDRNGRRNADEIRLWQAWLNGALGHPSPALPFVLMGNANLDPLRGEGRRAAIRDLLADPRLVDPLPGRSTVDWSRLDLGDMRVSYVLPSADLSVRDAGVVEVPEAGEHRLVWVDVALSDEPEG
ncbi:endonuclease/exonuclease/phosphatase family protein [Roseivivax marinus]|uniref:endonuclease/exonuclease/phosphatase family protein n=1 Tax=Roseivivax marinus TaxID=1379903 RepID=UPI00273D33C6|nr:endonuclease/exonuclease/phosphatase family protein [Roseivivax marinus]